MEEKGFNQYNGYRVYMSSISQESLNEVFLNSTTEILYLFFDDFAPALIQTYGANAINLICDPVLRNQIIPTFDSYQKVKNPRGNKAIKKTGKINLFLTTSITNNIRRSPIIYNLLSSLYGKQKLAFTNGLDPIIYKTKGSEDYPVTIDCKIFQQLETFDGLDNPFHYCCFVCISLYQNSGGVVDSRMEYGQISLLENFDYHYDFVRQLIDPRGKYPIEKQKKGVDFNLLENLNIEAINKEIADNYNKSNLENRNVKETGMKNLDNARLLKWTTVKIQPGNILVFDCRLPYKISKNLTNTPAVYVPVSLRPIPNKWFASEKHSKLLNSVKNGKVGDWDKRTFKDCNLDEYHWRMSKDCPNFSKLENCINLKDFKPFDRGIFGLDDGQLIEN